MQADQKYRYCSLAEGLKVEQSPSMKRPKTVRVLIKESPKLVPTLQSGRYLEADRKIETANQNKAVETSIKT
jgi:hypothetical protein